MSAKSSTKEEGFFLIALLIGTVAMLQLPLFKQAEAANCPGIIIAYSIFLFLCLIPIALTHFRVYELTAEGITLKWLGMHRSHTPWKDVRNVSRVYLNHGMCVLLVVTHKCADVEPVALPDGLCSRSRILNREVNRGNAFFLKDSPHILACVQEYYGNLNFDCRRF